MTEAVQRALRWRPAGAEPARALRLGDGAIVFNSLSWQTHYLNEAALCVFDALAARAMTVPELIEDIVDEHEALDPARRAEWMQTLRRHLDDLARMGLVVAEPDLRA